MTQKFLLYDDLVSKIDANEIDWLKVCSTINSLPIEHLEIIYALILHHYLLDMQMKSANPNLTIYIDRLRGFADGRKPHIQQPYGVRVFSSGKGIMFTVNSLPEQLQHIISTYVYSISKS